MHKTIFLHISDKMEEEKDKRKKGKEKGKEKEDISEGIPSAPILADFIPGNTEIFLSL